jgi:hypothetical protein
MEKNLLGTHSNFDEVANRDASTTRPHPAIRDPREDLARDIKSTIVEE